MADIKTRESLRSIKTVNKAKRLAEKLRRGAYEAKYRADEMQNTAYEDETKYAGDKTEYYAKRIGQKTVNRSTDLVRRGMNAGTRKLRKRIQEHPSAAKSVKTAKKQIKNTQKAAKRAAEASKKMAQATARAAKVAAQAVVKAVKAIAAGAKALVSAIAAGGWVAVLIIVIVCIIALVCAAVFGWLIPNDDDYSLRTAIYTVQSGYNESLEDIKSKSTYDELEIVGEPKWRDIVCTFAVLTNLNPENSDDLMSVDPDDVDRLRNIFWNMVDVGAVVNTETKERITYVTENGMTREVRETVEVKVLYIKVHCKSAFEMKEHYSMNKKQKELLDKLMSPDFDVLWSGFNI